MSLTQRSENVKRSRYLANLSIWVALAVLISGLERLIPFPVPWVKLGLANGITLLVLLGMGPIYALVVSLLRITLVATIFGTWLSPVLLISFSGGMVSLLVMVVLFKFLGKSFSPVGLSVAGAFTHMAVQFLVVAFLVMRNSVIFSLLGPSLLAAVASGIIVGFLVMITLNRLPASLLFPVKGEI